VVIAFLFFTALFVALKINFARRERHARQHTAELAFPDNTTILVPEPIEAPAVPHFTFGTSYAFGLTAGTNQFLDLDKVQLLTNSGDFPSLFIGNWLNQSGADLLYAGDEKFMAFGGVFSPAPKAGSTEPDDWDATTPDQVRSAMDRFGLSPHGRTVNLLTKDQSDKWYFKTREGSEGVLQIVDFTNDPPAAIIRYKLIEQTNGQGAASSLHADNSYEDLLRQRLKAASMMNDATSRDRAIASVAIDAATMGKAKVATEALHQMFDATMQAKTARETVRLFVKQGLRKEALVVADLISDSVTRDEALAEVAK